MLLLICINNNVRNGKIVLVKIFFVVFFCVVVYPVALQLHRKKPTSERLTDSGEAT